MIARADEHLPAPLTPFEGQDVVGSRIKVTNAGDGLSESLAVEPAAFGLGSKLYVVLECEVAKVQHVPVKDTDTLVREHTFKALGATLADADLVAELVEQQKEIIRLRKEEAAGIQRLTFAPDPDTSGYDLLLERLGNLRKPELRALCEANAVEAPKSATSARMAELLAELPGIDQILSSYEKVPEEGDNVTPISDRQPAEPYGEFPTTDEEWEDKL
jgi:hypothetical protein